MQRSPMIQRIDSLIRPSLEDMGFEVVRIRLSSQRGKKCLQVMAEPKGGIREMTVEDCADVSRHISALMDVEDPISGTYDLEVSSPGIDRPLVSVKDFERYVGHIAKVEMAWPIDGRKRFRGEILSVENVGKEGKEAVRIEVDAQHDALLGIADMESAKLVLTDALIDEHQAKAKDANAKESQ